MVGCKKPIQKETISISGDSATIDFILNSSIQLYDVEFQVKYNYGFDIGLDTLNGELISPSRVKYSDWTHLSAKKRNQAGVGVKSLMFHNVPYEEGTFKLSISKERGKITLKKGTLKIYEGDISK